MAAAPDLSQIPPSDIPDALQDGIAKLSAPLKQLLMMKSVPYLIQHRLGSENYVTVADRWDSAQVARQQGPRELGFEADHSCQFWLCCNETIPGREGRERDDPDTPIGDGHSGTRAF